MVSMATENNNTGGELRRTVRRVPQARGRQRRRHRQGHASSSVGKDYVVVDIGYKSEGPDPARRVHAAPTAQVSVKAGDDVDVFLESRENDDGLVVLSKEKADKMQGLGRDLAPRASATSSSKAPSAQRVKGGLSVTIRGGVKAFLPGSQVDLRPVRNLDEFIGKTYQFKVIKFNKKRGNIVLSRRVLLEKERAELKEQTLETLEGGPDRRGHRQEHHRVRRVRRPRRHRRPAAHHRHVAGAASTTRRELFQVGDEVRVKVLKFDAETERVSLGLKQISEDPWTHAQRAVPARHASCSGKVVIAHRLRRVRRARAGHRGPRPRLRDVVDQAGQAPVEDRRRRRHGRGGGARRRPDGRTASRSA